MPNKRKPKSTHKKASEPIRPFDEYVEYGLDTTSKENSIKKSQTNPKTSNTAPEDQVLTPKQYLKNLLEAIPQEAIVFDEKSRWVLLNELAIKAFGHVKTYYARKNLTRLVKEPITSSKLQTMIKELKEKNTKETWPFERRLKNRKFEPIIMAVKYFEYQQKGYVLGLIFKKSESDDASVKDNSKSDLFHLLSDQIADGLFATDIEGVILYANKAAESIVKEKNQQTVGKHFKKYIARKSLTKAMKAFRDAKEGKATIREELNIVDTNGEFIPVEFTTSPIYKDGTIVQLHTIIQDVRKKKQIEHVAKETDKMEAVQNFILGTAHEIQKPLEGLLSQAQTLIQEYKDRSYEYIGFKEFQEIMGKLESMKDQIKYCTDTVSRLDEMNRKKAGLTNQFCDVNVVAKEVLQSRRHQISISDVQLKTSFARNIPKVAISAIELNQVISNIITNAIQSMPGGGKLQFSTQFNRSKNMVRVSCRDEGVGIPKETLAHVYEPFFTTKERGLEKSSGLGLSIVYSIVKQYNGEIKIDSTLRTGTNVHIYFPVHSSSETTSNKTTKQKSSRK